MNVIPIMDHIDNLLSDSAKQPLTPSIKYALCFTQASINKYYSLSDNSNIYRIAMGMSKFPTIYNI